MRLRDVGPGIGGLNYSPLLRDTNEKAMRRALGRLAPESAGDAGPASLWQAIRATARKVGRRLVEARMAEAQRIVDLETARLGALDGTSFRRDAIGSRYY